MSYWWVNHKQTYLAEIEGGYIWSPKLEKNGNRSQFYDNLTKVEPCDVVFSYANTKIMAIGMVSGSHREQPKPPEFGASGVNWADTGWLVPIDWEWLRSPFSPRDHISAIKPLLPARHSPIRENGVGNQKCYLAEISQPLYNLLLGLAVHENPHITDWLMEQQAETKSDVAAKEVSESNLEKTYKEQIIKARVGQGLFRKNVMAIERECRVTKVSLPDVLIASHIKPWRDSNNKERLDGQNGLLLSPHVDRLFDIGWISFTDDGDVLVRNDAVKSLTMAWGINAQTNVGAFTDKQKKYLAYHREHVFKEAG